MAKLKDGTRIYGNANINATLTTLDLVVTGNMTIQGTTTTVDSTVSTVKDPLITLGANVTGAVPDDGHERGLILKYAPSGVATDAFLGWHTSNGEFALASNIVFDSANNEVTTINTYGNVRADHFKGEGDTLGNITGANVTGTVANANNSAYAGTVTGASQGNITSLGNLTAFQVGDNGTTGKVVITTDGTINASGIVNVTSSATSTSSSEGALRVTGGAGIGGNLYVGGNIYGNFAGEVLAKGLNTYVQFNDGGTQNATSGFTFSKTDNKLVVTGTANVGNLETAGTINATKTANVGNLVTPGFANIDKDLLVGTGASAANANITGSLQVAATANVGNLVTPGIANIDGELHVGTVGVHANATITGNLTVVDNYSSTNGNLTLTNGNITVGGAANVTGTANVGNLTTGGNIDGTGSSSTANVKYLEIRSTANIAGTANVGNLVTPGYANINKDLLVGTGALAANANVTGSLKVGSILGDLIPSTNYGGDLGNSTNAWKDLYLSGSSIKIGTQTISTTTGTSGIAISNNLTVTTLEVGGNANIGNSSTSGNLQVFGTVWANGNISSNTFTNSYVTFANGNVLSGNTNFTFDEGNVLLKTGNVELTGTANVNDATVRSLTSTGGIVFGNSTHGLVDNANLTFDTSGNTLTTDNLGLRATANVGNVVLRSLANTQLSFANATNALVGSANLTFDTTSNTLSATNITGTFTAAASSQPNITSLGTLTGLVASGNIQSNANIITDAIITKGTGNLTITAGATDGNIILAPQGSGTINASSKRITSIATPTDSADAATKGYVDANSQGLDIKASVRLATTGNRALTGLTAIDSVTPIAGDRILVKAQTAGEENGIYVAAAGAWARAVDAVQDKITGGSFTFVEEGSTLRDTGWVVSTDNPITVGTTAIVWTQFSSAGTVSANVALSKVGNEINVKFDTTTLAVSGSNELKVADSATFVTPNIGAATGSSLDIATGNLTANVVKANSVSIQNSGNITGANVISGTTLTGTLSTASQPNITSVGTLTSLSVDGGTLSVANANLTIGSAYGIKSDNYWYANGTAIDFQTAAGNATELQFKATGTNDLAASANLTFGSGNLTVTGNILNATGAIISGNIQANNVTNTHVVFAGTDSKLTGSSNMIWDNANQVLKVGAGGSEIGGDAGYGYVKAANVTATNLTDTRLVFSNSDHKLIDNANLTFSGTQLNVTGAANVSGTVNAGNVTSNGVADTQVVFATTGGRLTSDSDLTFDGTELKANAANVVNEFTAGNVTSRTLQSGRITYAGTAGLLKDSANLTFDGNVMTVTGNIQLNGTSGVGSLTGNGSISMTGNISGANIDSGAGLISTTGNANVGNLNATHVYGTIETASQPNITSVGTLTSLNVSGTSNLNAVGNVTITGGTAGQYLRATNSSGGLEYASVDASKIANGTSNVSIPTVDGNIIMVRGGTTVVTVTGSGANVTGYVSVDGDIQGNNITALTGYVINAQGTTDATSSITGTIKTAGGISAQGNIYTGHSVGFANNNGGTASKAYIQYNSTADSLDFIFN